MARSKTVTLEGAEALRFLAQASAVHCMNQREAYRLLRNAEGPYKRALAVELKRYGFKIPKHATEAIDAGC